MAANPFSSTASQMYLFQGKPVGVIFHNLMRRHQKDHDEADELLSLLHRLIAKVNIGYEKDPHQNVGRIVIYFY